MKFFAALLLTLSSAVFAHDAQHDIEYDSDGNLIFEAVSVRIDVAPDDAGRSGSLFVAMESPSNGKIYTLNEEGWSYFDGGIPAPLSGFVDLNPKTELTIFYFDPQWLWFNTNSIYSRVFRDSRFARYAHIEQHPSAPSSAPLCAYLTQMGVTTPVNIWVGYGALQDKEAERIATYHSIKNPRIPPDHLKSMYIYQDGHLNEKYAKVLTICDGVPPGFSSGN